MHPGEELADQVLEAWDDGRIPDGLAVMAWWCIFLSWPT